MNSTLLSRVLKGVAGGLLLIILLFVVTRWWGEYRTTDTQPAAGPTTQTAAPPVREKGESTSAAKAKQPSKSSKTLVVLTEGLRFRESASQASNEIRRLDRGTRLTVIKKDGNWYQVQDGEGVKGWVSANPDYVKIQ